MEKTVARAYRRDRRREKKWGRGGVCEAGHVSTVVVSCSQYSLTVIMA